MADTDTGTGLSDSIRAAQGDVPVWDAHSCVPLRIGADLSGLARHKASGVDFVSINVGMDMTPVPIVLGVVAYFRAWLQTHHESFVLADSVDAVRQAKQEGKLAVAFDLEGALPLEGRVELVDFYRRFGVKQMHLIYNRSNAVGGGCHDEDDGLTDFGRQVITTMNECGVVLDCSHAGERTSLDMIAHSAKPAVFSHANVRALVDHARNVSDAQIDACAASGGVIGINGVDLFLGEAGAGAEAMLRHIDYIAQRVGPRHVGIGLDYSYEGSSDLGEGVDEAYWWPPAAGYNFSTLHFAAPEIIPELADRLSGHGYSGDDLRGILGGNFMRVAEETWKPVEEQAAAD
jgi:membrane dipeptidase